MLMSKVDYKLREDIREELLRHLQEKNQIIPISKSFFLLKSNEKRVSFAYDLLQENRILPQLSIDKKNNKKSEEFRQKGNEWFKNKNSKKALECYTKSVAFAKSGSQNLALAYANRSAVLFENGLYQECLIDINLTLKNDYPERLMSKLLARQAKATELLPSQKKVEFLTPVPSIPKKRQNTLIQSAMDSIQIEDSKELGRHIIASKDIEPGEIIAVEDPFCQTLIAQFLTHCHHCLKLCYTLIPCEMCTEAMFCSESCKLFSYESYHQFECKILLTIQHMELMWRLVHLRITIVARSEYDKISNLVPDKEGIYRSDRYNEIHNLVANTSKRSVSDLFNRAVYAAAFFHLLRSHTCFFKTDLSEDVFKNLLLHHMQTGPCNFHEILEHPSSDKSMEGYEIGSGAYSFLSMFNHSCCPNVVRYSYGSTTVLIALETIKKGDQCFDNYGYHYAVMPKSDRQAKLQKQYLFKCSCIACTNDYPLYDNLKEIKRRELLISQKDLHSLEEGDLEKAKKIFQKTIRAIKLVENTKPNKNLAEMQECLKQSYFIFKTINTPI
ncbi:SET and MYND domain-containing protein 4 isoform X2 [Anthonomus grandis grandis]|uniref:SET and MYND domain-containing protein 4 isoform X2 n=1 Tax=Anthonomus grandis grandis TaxID=2921223 RepID=UPI0021655DB7|nr:SET and MYND domain-containing protein 4 isoform X2 [Anthonomus grandis grandis]